MKRILLSHSYFLRFDPKQWANGQPYAPIGTLYVAAMLRKLGHEVSFFDTMFSHEPLEIIPSLDKERPQFFILCDDGFNYLTKMCLTNMREAAFAMMKMARERGCTVIVSSSDSTDHYEQYLLEGANYVILGEPEQSIAQLIAELSAEAPNLLVIPGLAYMQKDAVIKTAKRNVLKELDSLPFPAWDLIDMEPYKRTWLKSKGYFSMNMATTRGCPFKCNWCAKPIYGNRYNSRSVQNVVEELKMIRERFHFDHIWFCDDIFGLTPGWVRAFAELVEKENLQFRFKVQARADLLLQEDYVHDLARAGCESVWIGAESGSQKILDAMDKGTTVEQIYHSTNLMKKHGILPSFFIQFGYPGETKEDILKTIGMINDLLPHEIGISVSYPLPGTRFYDRVKEDMKLKSNWTDSDDLALMFRNTFAPAFYKQLHRYVHKNYRKHLALASLKKIFTQPKSISIPMLRKAASLIYYTPATWLAGQKLSKIEMSGI